MTHPPLYYCISHIDNRAAESSPWRDGMGMLSNQKSLSSSLSTIQAEAFRAQSSIYRRLRNAHGNAERVMVRRGDESSRALRAPLDSGVDIEAFLVHQGTGTTRHPEAEGMSPQAACKAAVERILKQKPQAKTEQVGYLAINKKGEVGAWAIQKGFSYSLCDQTSQDRVVPGQAFYEATPGN